MTPEAIKQLATAFAKLPSIGPRQALRLAFHVASNDQSVLHDLQNSLTAVSALTTCPQCFFVSDQDGQASAKGGQVCVICANKNRNPLLVAVVEKETDLITLERAKKFNGVYLVLGALRSDGVLEPRHRTRLATLKKRLESEKAEEIILALSPTTYGDIQATVLAQELKDSTDKLTRLGRGLPTGGEIEFSDEETLADALKNRS